jgi:ABC-2 type transport system permease protein
MKSFSDEKKQGTLEILFTKPLSLWEIVNGKFLGAFILILIAIIPTLFYVFIVSSYTAPQSTFDYGSTIGSYFGLLFLIGAYTAIGVFTSTLSDNQIVAFIVAVFLCFFFYFGFDGLANLFGNFANIIKTLGMDFHFKSMSRGVLDTRDIIYFISITVLFLAGTVYQLKALKW